MPSRWPNIAYQVEFVPKMQAIFDRVIAAAGNLDTIDRRIIVFCQTTVLCEKVRALVPKSRTYY